MKKRRKIILLFSLLGIYEPSIQALSNNIGGSPYNVSNSSIPENVPVRCYYRTFTGKDGLDYDYALARNANNTTYQLIGSWGQEKKGFDLSNPPVIYQMFFTDTPQAAIKQICSNTLLSQGIKQPLAMITAEGNPASPRPRAKKLDYTIWSNDTAAQESVINRVVVFGDSLSDLRNAARLVNEAREYFPNIKNVPHLPNEQSWFFGHYSNGEVWPEYLAESKNIAVYNWAVANAATESTMLFESSVPVLGKLRWPGLIQEVNSFITYKKYDTNYQPENTEFIFFIGSIDALSNLDTNRGLKNLQNSIASLLNSFNSPLEKYNIVLLNIPDVTKAPLFESAAENKKQQILNNVNNWNNGIPLVVDEIKRQYPNTNVHIFNMYQFFNDVIANPQSYGFNNVTTSCLYTGNIGIDNPNWSGIFLIPLLIRSECQPDSYIFWDVLHPTTKMHKVLFEELSHYIN